MECLTLDSADNTYPSYDGGPAPAPQPERESILDGNGCAWIPESRLGLLQDKVEKLNRRAARLGCSPIGVTVVSERFVPRVRDDNGAYRIRRDVQVQVSGTAPAVAGWTFVARITHGEAGNVVITAPSERGVALPESLWVAGNDCDHCHTARRRVDTFVLRHTTDGTMQRVGRSCLADFLRSEDVEMALAFWKYLYEVSAAIARGDDDDNGPGGCGGRHYEDTKCVLQAAAVAIRVEGWTSRATARERGEGATCTADTVRFILDPPRCNDPLARREIEDRLRALASVPADEKVATDTLEWIRRRLDPTSDYERNLKAALGADYLDPRNLGLVVSAVQAWLRQVQARDAILRPRTSEGSWLGQPGQRLRGLRVRITLSRCFESQMGGTTNLIVFTDAAGNELKWFATGTQNLTVGRDVILTGTVKKHDEYKGRKCTMINRCVVEE